MKRVCQLLCTVISLNVFSQNVGIGTSTPAARFHVVDSSVLFSATGDIPSSPGNTPISGSGRRMMWYADKAAFRAGIATGNEWDKINVGDYTFASGHGTRAFGIYSIAMGYANVASNNSCVALGNSTTASGTYSTAMGNNTSASGPTSTAMGNYTSANGSSSIATGLNSSASGYASTAMGQSTSASGPNSTAMGINTSASGNGSTAMGLVTSASGDGSTAMGFFSSASGRESTAMGFFSKSKSFAGTVIGIFNDSTNAADQVSINPNNRIFQIGNGTDDNARSNAMTVLQNGNVGIGILVPSQMLEVAGNLTVQNGKGLIRNTDGTQLKKLSAPVTVNASFTAGQTQSFAVTWPEAFNAGNIEAHVGNVTSGAGGWAEVVMTVTNVTTTGATLYVYNPKTSTVAPNFTIKVIAIGPQ